MAWIIQSVSEGPVVVNDIGITLTKGQIRDLDLLGGRENAERSGDIKLLIQKGFLREIRKDLVPVLPGTVQMDPQVIAQLQQATSLAAVQGEVMQKLQEQNAQLQQQNAMLQQQMKAGNEQSVAIMEKTNKILAEVQSYTERHPNEIRAMREAIENIQIESKEIAEKRAEIARQGGAPHTESELKAHDKVLAMKGRKLEKNLGAIGKKVAESSDSIQEALDAMDELGIS